MNIVRIQKWLLVSSLAIAVAWSLLMWAVYGVLSVTDEGLATLLSRVGASPATEEWTLWLGLLAQEASNIAVILMWSVWIVSLVLLTWFARTALGRWPKIYDRLHSRTHTRERKEIAP